MFTTSSKGDFVIAPFAFSDGTCPHCRHGITSACVAGGFFPMNGDGGQGEAVRVPLADGTLVGVPGHGDSDELMRSLLTLSDVMATGHHAAVCARCRGGRHGCRRRRRRGGAMRRPRREASRGRPDHRAQPQPARQELAREFGATDIVEPRGEEATEAVLALTDGVGVDATLECVGTGQAMDTAFSIARPGSMVGYVGVPHGVELPLQKMFFRNKGLLGGSAPVRTYIPELLDDVLEGRINPGVVLDFETDLDDIAEAYAAMDERRAIKSLVRVGTV